MKRSYVPVALGVITLLALLPAVIYYAIGDRLMHGYYLECFAGDIWRGVLYPRWCMEASGQLGSPVFMFYFPLAYWISAPFYPLTWAGVPLDTVLAALLWVATFAAAWSCFRWLRTLVSPLAALLGAGMFILAPYHAELLLFRVAYSELWFMALLPLFFLQLRHVTLGVRHAWLWLALAFALMVLTHAPGAVIVGFGSAAYLAVAWWQEGWKMLRRGALAAAGAALGAAGSAFYWAPALYYTQYVTPRPTTKHGHYADRYPDLLLPQSERFEGGVLAVPYLNTSITLALLVGLAAMAARFLRKPGVQEELSTLKRELLRYMAVFAVAAFMFVPVLEPLWRESTLMRSVIFPWRFQLLWVMPLALLTATLAEAHCRKIMVRRAGDLLIPAVFLVLLSFGLVSATPQASPESLGITRKMMYLNIYAFAPRWLTTMEYKDFEYVATHIDDPHILDKAPTTTVDINTWKAGTIVLRVNSARVSSVTLRHLYFPAWVGTLRRGTQEEKLDIKPSAEGRMIFLVPAGESEVVMRYRPYYKMWQEITKGKP